MKTDRMEFDTGRTVREITDILRKFRCNIEALQTDPMGRPAGRGGADVKVLMWDKATFKDALKHFGAGLVEWGVQVYVYDRGNSRHVELVALGESARQAAQDALAETGGSVAPGSGYWTMAMQVFSMRIGKDYRDRIAGAIA